MSVIDVHQVIDISAPVSEVFKTITAYSKYPKFMLGVKKAKVQKKIDKNHAIVEYAVSLLGKEVSYVLNMEAVSEKSLTWTLNKSKYLDTNNGGWRLTPKGKAQCSVEYSLVLGLPIPAPSFVINRGATTYVREMLDKFKTYCEASV